MVSKNRCKSRLFKKKLDTHLDTRCIKIGVQLWSEWRDSNSRHPGPKRIREFFLTFLAPFSTFIHNSRWYSELSSPLIPPVFSVVVVKTVVKKCTPLWENTFWHGRNGQLDRQTEMHVGADICVLNRDDCNLVYWYLQVDFYISGIVSY